MNVKYVDCLSFFGIVDVISENIVKVKDGKFSVVDMSNIGMMIINIGFIGGGYFMLIVNWLEVVIIGMGKIF